ncbi:hypothetical protein P0Y35_00550 [Kiritimatiellaeota bacterium B1221]|nr:hypothetical protein [Kiritimatiellaeota bacterium B1221]
MKKTPPRLMTFLILSAFLFTLQACGRKNIAESTRKLTLKENTDGGALLASAIQETIPEGGSLVVWAEENSPTDQALLKGFTAKLDSSAYELIPFSVESLILPPEAVRERMQAGDPVPQLTETLRNATPEISAFVVLTGGIPVQSSADPVSVFTAVLTQDQIDRMPLPPEVRGYVLREHPVDPAGKESSLRLVTTD